MASLKIRVLPDPAAVAEAAADRIVMVAETAIATEGTFSLALAGGNTPRQLYELLASEPFIGKIPWDKVQVFFGDERCVPPGHAQSNFRMASETLLDAVPIPPANIHRIRGEIEPEAAAMEYGQLLKARFGDGGVDVALLGMGEDGHTASLFPNSPALDEQEHRCVAVHVDKLNAWRITMTPMFLNRSKEVIVLITGQTKAGRVQQALEGPTDPKQLPIQLISPPEGRVTWLLDAAAAQMS